MRISVNEALLEDHVNEHFRDQLGQVLQVKALPVHLFDSCDRKACLVGHYKDSLLRVLIVNFWNTNTLSIFEYLGTALGIVRFNDKVKLARQSSLELVCEPTVPEVGEDGFSSINTKLNHRQVPIDVFFDPAVLDLHCNSLSCALQGSLVDLA